MYLQLMSAQSSALQKQTLSIAHHITSHHMEKTEAGLKGLYIREITIK